MFWTLPSLLFIFPAFATHKLHERFKWSVIEYEFSGELERSEAIASGRYIPTNNLPLGIEIWKDKLFVTVPRWRSGKLSTEVTNLVTKILNYYTLGVPSTLNFVHVNNKTPPSPPLHPFPDWSTAEPGNCGVSLTNVQKVKADSCDRLWVLDTGTIGFFNTTTRLCPITLSVYDLKTNIRLRKYELPLNNLTPRSFVANIEVDEGTSCDDTFAYMADELGYGLIAYSWELNKSWRFSHSYFKPDPLAYDFHVGGINFQWEDIGIFSMAISPKQSDDFRTLLFSPLTSNREFAVSTKILRDPSKIHNSHQHFLALEERGPNGHVTAKTMTKNGIQFFALIDVNALGCWNAQIHPFHPNFLGIADKDDEDLVFISDVKIDLGQDIWVISNKLPLFLYVTLNCEEINFRVFWAPAKVLVHGTPCEGKYTPFAGYGEGFSNKWLGNKYL